MFQFIRKYRLHFIFLLCLISFMLYERSILIFSYSTDLDGLEYMFIHYTQNILYHKKLYCSSNVYPFDICVHMPLYPYTMSTIFRFLHYMDPNIMLRKVECIYKHLIICRMLSFVFLWVCLYFIVRTLWLFNRNKFITFFTVCFAMLFLTGHFYAARQDAIKMAFFLILVYNSIRYLSGGKIKFLFLSFIFITLSISCKQDSVLFIGQFLLIALFVFRSKRGLLLMSVYIFSILLVCFIFWNTFGNEFIDNTILINFQINKSNLDSYNLLACIFSVGRSMPFLIFLTYLYIRNKQIVKQDPSLFLLIIFCYTSYVTAHVLIFRASSYINYTHETMAYIVITLAALTKYEKRDQLIISFAFIMGILLLYSDNMIHAYPFSNAKEQGYKKNYLANLQLKKTLNPIIANNKTYFLSSEHTLFYPDEDLIYGYDLHIDRFMHTYLGFTTQARMLFLNSRKYDSYFKNGSIQYVIIDDNNRSAEIMKENYPEYTVYKKVGNLVLYRYGNI
ncbi:MAG: hypothetical protein JWN78_1231 [Bacteroidota bacterium]|nr:hypothetical protein [Bacteroidota bacterium]